MVIPRTQLRQSRRSAIAGAAMAASLLLAGCGTSATPQPSPSLTSPSIATSTAGTASSQPSTAATSQTQTPSTNATQQPSDDRPLGTPDLADKQQPAKDSQGLVVTNVRLGLHDGYERVVFETTGSGQAGWFAGLTNEPRQPGSGFPIDYDGEVALQIAIRGVVYPWDANAAEFEDSVPGHGGIITGISNQKTYEGQHQFTIGLQRAVPYSITWLDEPGRVVVDFQTR